MYFPCVSVQSRSEVLSPLRYVDETHVVTEWVGQRLWYPSVPAIHFRSHEALISDPMRRYFSRISSRLIVTSVWHSNTLLTTPRRNLWCQSSLANLHTWGDYSYDLKLWTVRAQIPEQMFGLDDVPTSLTYLPSLPNHISFPPSPSHTHPSFYPSPLPTPNVGEGGTLSCPNICSHVSVLTNYNLKSLE